MERTERKYSSNLRYSYESYVTAEQDADYMEAVESGDMETAQRMVDVFNNELQNLEVLHAISAKKRIGCARCAQIYGYIRDFCYRFHN